MCAFNLLLHVIRDFANLFNAKLKDHSKSICFEWKNCVKIVTIRNVFDLCLFDLKKKSHYNTAFKFFWLVKVVVHFLFFKRKIKDTSNRPE